MALSMTITKSSGLAFEAYLRVIIRASDLVSIAEQAGRQRSAILHFDAYGSEAARRTGHPVEKVWSETAPADLVTVLLGTGTREQKLTAVYTYLKTQPAYADAVDC